MRIEFVELFIGEELGHSIKGSDVRIPARAHCLRNPLVSAGTHISTLGRLTSASFLIVSKPRFSLTKRHSASQQGLGTWKEVHLKQ